MTYRLLQAMNWLASDPRRARSILFVTLTALALVPGGSALAGQAPGGSG
ncbi:MAG TPA: hypothetical protein PKD09_03730 [Aggregatilinea sp.]|jgi:hypothetical protein|nr:hypothetical protein [Aggregatilinea sp.]HML20734.1 hypothetical protein [Aggregatilinea sp.]